MKHFFVVIFLFTSFLYALPLTLPSAPVDKAAAAKARRAEVERQKAEDQERREAENKQKEEQRKRKEQEAKAQRDADLAARQQAERKRAAEIASQQAASVVTTKDPNKWWIRDEWAKFERDDPENFKKFTDQILNLRGTIRTKMPNDKSDQDLLVSEIKDVISPFMLTANPSLLNKLKDKLKLGTFGEKTDLGLLKKTLVNRQRVITKETVDPHIGGAKGEGIRLTGANDSGSAHFGAQRNEILDFIQKNPTFFSLTDPDDSTGYKGDRPATFLQFALMKVVDEGISEENGWGDLGEYPGLNALKSKLRHQNFQTRMFLVSQLKRGIDALKALGIPPTEIATYLNKIGRKLEDKALYSKAFQLFFNGGDDHPFKQKYGTKFALDNDPETTLKKLAELKKLYDAHVDHEGKDDKKLSSDEFERLVQQHGDNLEEVGNRITELLLPEKQAQRQQEQEKIAQQKREEAEKKRKETEEQIKKLTSGVEGLQKRLQQAALNEGGKETSERWGELQQEAKKKIAEIEEYRKELTGEQDSKLDLLAKKLARNTEFYEALREVYLIADGIAKPEDFKKDIQSALEPSTDLKIQQIEVNTNSSAHKKTFDKFTQALSGLKASFSENSQYKEMSLQIDALEADVKSRNDGIEKIIKDQGERIKKEQEKMGVTALKKQYEEKILALEKQLAGRGLSIEEQKRIHLELEEQIKWLGELKIKAAGLGAEDLQKEIEELETSKRRQLGDLQQALVIKIADAEKQKQTSILQGALRRKLVAVESENQRVAREKIVEKIKARFAQQDLEKQRKVHQVISNNVSRFLARIKVKKLREEEQRRLDLERTQNEAAIKIQALARGKRDRKIVAQLKEEKKQEALRLEQEEQKKRDEEALQKKQQEEAETTKNKVNFGAVIKELNEKQAQQRKTSAERGVRKLHVSGKVKKFLDNLRSAKTRREEQERLDQEKQAQAAAEAAERARLAEEAQKNGTPPPVLVPVQGQPKKPKASGYSLKKAREDVEIFNKQQAEKNAAKAAAAFPALNLASPRPVVPKLDFSRLQQKTVEQKQVQSERVKPVAVSPVKKSEEVQVPSGLSNDPEYQKILGRLKAAQDTARSLQGSDKGREVITPKEDPKKGGTPRRNAFKVTMTVHEAKQAVADAIEAERKLYLRKQGLHTVR